MESVHYLIFGADLSTRPELPTAEDCSRAATWAADRGYLDVAADLMALARTLWRQRIETPTTPVPVYTGPVREELPRGLGCSEHGAQTGPAGEWIGCGINVCGHRTDGYPPAVDPDGPYGLGTCKRCHLAVSAWAYETGPAFNVLADWRHDGDAFVDHDALVDNDSIRWTDRPRTT